MKELNAILMPQFSSNDQRSPEWGKKDEFANRVSLYAYMTQRIHPTDRSQKTNIICRGEGSETPSRSETLSIPPNAHHEAWSSLDINLREEQLHDFLCGTHMQILNRELNLPS